MQPFETIYVDGKVVACDGGDALGHPRVYLNLGVDGKVECPYCSRLFILRASHGDEPAPGALPRTPGAPAPPAKP